MEYSKECRVCGRKDLLIAGVLDVCSRCIRMRFEESRKYIEKAHRSSRERYSLPPQPPHGEGVQCNICGNKCIIPPGGRGYCGVNINANGRLTQITGSPLKAVGLYYLDPHPTNCVADWVCPGATGRGYPRFSLVPRGPEKGYYNVAVFYGACNMDCLYCQNWEYREMASKGCPVLSIDDLVRAVSTRTTCVCFFGGDPGPQMIHALASARAMVRRAREIGLKVFRVCWETNGLIDPRLLDQAVELSLRTGGIVKIDLKAYSPEIYYALTGNDGRLVYRSIERVARRFGERKDPPLLVVSTLLVPGYIDEHEIDGITRFIAELNPEIPVRFLAFHPDYMLRDLPPTSRRHALEALKIAKENGLKNVSIGNWWLLGDYY